MVTAPIVLLIAVASSPEGVAAADAVAAACREALPAGARTVVRTVAAAPPDRAAAAAASAAGASTAVILSWRDTGRLIGDVRVLRTDGDRGRRRETPRTVVFSARDQPAERTRALGLIIAAIVEEGAAAAREPAGPAPPRNAEDEEIPPVLAEPGLGRPGDPPRWALEANVISAVDRQEDFDDTIGGAVALRRALTARWTLRAGLGFRVADLDGASATARTLLGEVGVAWSSEGFGRAGAWGFGARADLLGVHESIKRDDPDDERFAGQWSLGLDLLGQVAFGLSAGTSLIAGAGVEGFLAGASLKDEHGIAATMGRGHLIFELGVLARF